MPELYETVRNAEGRITALRYHFTAEDAAATLNAIAAAAQPGSTYQDSEPQPVAERDGGIYGDPAHINRDDELALWDRRDEAKELNL